MIRYNLTIDSEIAAKFAEWQADRKGVIAWGNQELGGGHPLEVFTPRTAADQTDIAACENWKAYSPNWRYGNPALVDFDSLKVEVFTKHSEYRAKLKRFYWGIGLTSASESKAEREASKLGDGFTYRWHHASDYGQLNAIIELGKVETISFAEWQSRQQVAV